MPEAVTFRCDEHREAALRVIAMAEGNADVPLAPPSDSREASVVDLDSLRETANAIARSLAAHPESEGDGLSNERRVEIAALGRKLASLADPSASSVDRAAEIDDEPRPVPSTRELTSTEEDMLRSIEQAYEVRGRDEVWGLLRKYPFLLPVLAEMPAAIVSAYGNETTVGLRVSTTAKRQGRDHLLVDIQSPFDENAAFERFMEFEEPWWLERISQTDGLVSILM